MDSNGTHITKKEMLTVTYYVAFKIHNVVYILSVYWHLIYFFTALVNSVSHLHYITFVFSVLITRHGSLAGEV